MCLEKKCHLKKSQSAKIRAIEMNGSTQLMAEHQNRSIQLIDTKKENASWGIKLIIATDTVLFTIFNGIQ